VVFLGPMRLASVHHQMCFDDIESLFIVVYKEVG
jgi:hypothetical protein